MPFAGIVPRPSMRASGVDLLKARPSSARLFAFFLAYLAAAGFAEIMAITPGTGISIWPPAGLFMAVLVLTRKTSWPWWIAVAIGSELCASALWFHNPLLIALFLSAGNALCATAGALLLRRVRPLHLASLRQIGYLVFAGAVIAPLISATIGAWTVATFQAQDFVRAWQLWWIGDATGVLVVAPIVLVAAKTRPGAWIPRERTCEIVLVAAAFASAAIIVLSGRLPFAFLVMPPLLWAAIRFRFKGAVSIVLGLTLLTGAFTLFDASPFHGLDLEARDTQMMLQIFLAVSALSAWFVAAISQQQYRAVAALEAANLELETRVQAKTQRLQASEQAARARVAEIEAIYDAAPVGLVLFDIDLRFERINERLARINHRDAKDHIGRLAEEVLPGATATALREVLDRLKAGEDWVEIELGGPDPQGGADRHWLLSYQAIRDDAGHLLNVVGAVAEITQRKHAEERAALIVREVSHRSKSLLTLVAAVARQSLRGSDAERAAFGRLEKRLAAIAASQDLLMHGTGAGGASMETLARAQLAHFEPLIGERIILAGPTLQLNERAASAIGMALHELATNASKYGALSDSRGRVNVRWALVGSQFELTWVERDGPSVVQPARTGFGTQVIEKMTSQGLGGEVVLRFEPSGVAWRLTCPVAQIAISPETAVLPAKETGNDVT